MTDELKYLKFKLRLFESKPKFHFDYSKLHEKYIITRVELRSGYDEIRIDYPEIAGNNDIVFVNDLKNGDQDSYHSLYEWPDIYNRIEDTDLEYLIEGLE